MTHEQYTTPILNGTLIQLKLGDKPSVRATSFLSFENIRLPNNSIGLIVASKVWPDETWPNRDRFQKSAPYYKILFERDIVLVSERNVPSTLIQIIQNGST